MSDFPPCYRMTPAPRVRVRGQWRWFAALYVALARVHPWLAMAAAWPICKWVLAYWIDGERV